MKINSYDDFCFYQNVSRETFEKFILFKKTLIKWQKNINLISKHSIEDIWVRHFLDSAQLYRFTKNFDGNIVDFGSGAGFPGLILAIMGHKKIHLVESDQKKCTFLREVARLSEIDVIIHNKRIEDLEYFDVELVVARALAPLDKLIDYTESFANKCMVDQNFPKMLFLKGNSYKKEILELNKKELFDIQEFESITEKFSKILYINKINVLSINHEK